MAIFKGSFSNAVSAGKMEVLWPGSSPDSHCVHAIR